MDDNLFYTLRDINQRLKNKNNRRPKDKNPNLNNKNNDRGPKDKIVFRIWTKEKNQMAFQSEASTLNFFNHKWSKNKCPLCEAIYGSRDLKHKNDKLWVFKCPGCKSTLTVLNE